MEGISGEAASLAGHLKLSNLCWIYDDNHITIEGRTDLAFSEDVAKRFQGYGWNAPARRRRQRLRGRRPRRSRRSRRTDDRPTLIIVRSVIGYGSPHKQGTVEGPRRPAGRGRGEADQGAYGWPEDAQFLVPDGVRRALRRDGIGARGAQAARSLGRGLRRATPRPSPTWPPSSSRSRAGELPDGLGRRHPGLPGRRQGHRHPRGLRQGAERRSRRSLPWLVGGSADLAPSTKTMLEFDGAGDFEAGDYGGRNLHFGIREHAHGRDRQRPGAVRPAALRRHLPGLHRLHAPADPPGRADGAAGRSTSSPTTRSASARTARRTSRSSSWRRLRAIPDLMVIRPADANETAEAWRVIAGSRRRPGLPRRCRARRCRRSTAAKYAPAAGLAQGGYVLADAEGGAPEVILMATGSEVSLCVEAHATLDGEGRARPGGLDAVVGAVRGPAGRAIASSVLPPAVTARVAVEAGAPLGWDRYVGPTGEIIAMRTLRRLRPDQGRDAPLRLHRRACRRSGAGPGRANRRKPSR